MFEYFYHEILRKTIIAFGTLFNGIEIQHTDGADNTGSVQSIIRVPLAYGPTQKFLARLQQSPDLNKPTQISLPRMSFEFIGLTYDPTRKVTTTQTFTTSTVGISTQIRKAYMPVPYNMQFELSIYTKLNEDMLQIIEQILPYFQPAYTLTVNLVETLGEKRDIPVVLENVTMQDDYEGDFSTRRALYYTLRFTAKTYLFGKVPSADDSTRDIIKKVSVGYVADTSAKTRDLTYTVIPRATKNYDGDTVTNLAQDCSATQTLIEVDSASEISADDIISMNNESMFVEKIDSNKLFVIRGYDNTLPIAHVSGAGIGKITTADNALIETGDDFGFDGSYV